MDNSKECHLKESIREIQDIIGQIKSGEFSDRLGKVSVYMGTAAKSCDAYDSITESAAHQAGSDQKQHEKNKDAKIKGIRSSILNSIKFARMNLDQAMAQALNKLISRPRLMTKTDEVKRAVALQTWFDKVEDPTNAMLEHYKESSIPLDKYLVAGQWGHDYLRKRRINTGTYDRELCEILPCSDNAAKDVILNYGKLSCMIDALEENASKSL